MTGHTLLSYERDNLHTVWNPYSRQIISHSIILNYAYWCLFVFFPIVIDHWKSTRTPALAKRELDVVFVPACRMLKHNIARLIEMTPCVKRHENKWGHSWLLKNDPPCGKVDNKLHWYWKTIEIHIVFSNFEIIRYST